MDLQAPQNIQSISIIIGTNRLFPGVTLSVNPILRVWTSNPPETMSHKGGRRQTTIPAVMRPTSPAAASASSDKDNGAGAAAAALTTEEFRRELLDSLRSDFVVMLQKEVRAVLETEMTSFRMEVNSIKTGVEEFKSVVNTDLAKLHNTLGEAEKSWSSCSDDVTMLLNEVKRLSALTETLQSKCEDLESRSRRNNVRIVGVPEGDPQHSSPLFVGALLQKAFQLPAAVMVDRSHRSLQSVPKPGQPPRTIIARLHYFANCAEILRLAKTQQRIKVDNMTISVFPDYTAHVAKARAAFNGLRSQLRGLPGVRYGITHPARFHVSFNGVEKVFVDAGQAQSYVTQSIIPQFPPAAD